jgi:hypothetical protein
MPDKGELTVLSYTSSKEESAANLRSGFEALDVIIARDSELRDFDE